MFKPSTTASITPFILQVQTSHHSFLKYKHHTFHSLEYGEKAEACVAKLPSIWHKQLAKRKLHHKHVSVSSMCCLLILEHSHLKHKYPSVTQPPFTVYNHTHGDKAKAYVPKIPFLWHKRLVNRKFLHTKNLFQFQAGQGKEFTPGRQE